MAAEQPNNVKKPLCAGLLAHVDAGKTTLSEAMLYTAGALRKLDDRSMEELHRIFDVTGGKEFFDTIERHSDRKAREMGYDGADDEYMMDTYTKNSNEHY